MKKDPKVTGLCAVCGDPVPARKIHGVWMEDPFCNVTHCREWHGIPLPVTPTASDQSRSRKGKTADPMLEPPKDPALEVILAEANPL